MSVIDLNTLNQNDLKKSLLEQINIEEWIDKCTKCGYPKLIHKKMHRDAACTGEKEKQDVLCKNLEEYTKRIRPLLKVIKEDYKKEIQEGLLLKGLKFLIE